MSELNEELQNIIKSGHTPAVSYALIVPSLDKPGLTIKSEAVGKKSLTSDSSVNQNTQFPASSLSKLVFTYLVLKLAEQGKIELDIPLATYLRYDRFVIDGSYQEKAWKLTARHVLSHSADLSNFGPDSSAAVKFNDDYDLGKGYSYSGEAFLYLQCAIEKKMGKDLETLAQEYVFGPLEMHRTTFDPSSRDGANYVSVHTELGKEEDIYIGDPIVNAAGSLLTTGDDFSKLMAAWVAEKDEPTLGQAFVLAENNKCGLGWHLCPNEDNDRELIAYQFGQNPNTRAFVAINLATYRGAAFFTNSENGMSIANQVFSASGLANIGNMQTIYQNLSYAQSDKAGWQETLSGQIAEFKGDIATARECFERALTKAPNDGALKQRLIWFNNVRNFDFSKTYSQSLDSFAASFSNKWNDEMALVVNNGQLLLKDSNAIIKLVRISENEFLPEKNQSFKVTLSDDALVISYCHGGRDKVLSKDLTEQNHNNSSYGVMTRILGHEPISDSPIIQEAIDDGAFAHAEAGDLLITDDRTDSSSPPNYEIPSRSFIG